MYIINFKFARQKLTALDYIIFFDPKIYGYLQKQKQAKTSNSRKKPEKSRRHSKLKFTQNTFVYLLSFY